MHCNHDGTREGYLENPKNCIPGKSREGKERKDLKDRETWVQRKVRALHPKPRECSGKMAKR